MMYEIMSMLLPDMVEFSLISYIAILATLAIGPVYGFATYYFAGEGWRKSLIFASTISVWGVAMIAFVMHWQFTFTNPYVAPAVMLAILIIPSLLVLWNQDFFVPHKLGVNWLIGVQAFRYVGGLYLFEHFRGFVGPEFAYFAGTGDVLTAVIASILLLVYLHSKKLPTWSLYFLTIFGFLDFVWVVPWKQPLA